MITNGGIWHVMGATKEPIMNQADTVALNAGNRGQHQGNTKALLLLFQSVCITTSSSILILMNQTSVDTNLHLQHEMILEKQHFSAMMTLLG
jgi:hypothetical protein